MQCASHKSQYVVVNTTELQLCCATFYKFLSSDRWIGQTLLCLVVMIRMFLLPFCFAVDWASTNFCLNCILWTKSLQSAGKCKRNNSTHAPTMFSLASFFMVTASSCTRSPNIRAISSRVIVSPHVGDEMCLWMPPLAQCHIPQTNNLHNNICLLWYYIILYF